MVFILQRWYLTWCAALWCWPLCLIPGISNAEARQPGKAPNFSVNWTVGDQALEVINATTGKDDMGRASRLCKNALYSRWVRLHCKVNMLRFRRHPALHTSTTASLVLQYYYSITGSSSRQVFVESCMCLKNNSACSKPELYNLTFLKSWTERRIGVLDDWFIEHKQRSNW